MKNTHVRAVLLAFFVTLLWSSSWVFIRIGLADIPALTFAGLRYSLAFLVLLLYALRGGQLKPLRDLDARAWGRLLLLGLVYYAITQGAQFVGIANAPATMVSLLLSFTSVIVALLSGATLQERPTTLQWTGTVVALVGALVYFWGVSLSGSRVIGVVAGVVCAVANALSAILGRAVNRSGSLSPTAVTVVSMGIGSVVLLVAGIGFQGLPPLTPGNWALIVWLAVVSSALAFTLWNVSLQTLSATESTVINNTMLIQIAILAWLFLDESLSVRQIVGLALAAAGTLVVQLRRQPKTS